MSCPETSARHHRLEMAGRRGFKPYYSPPHREGARNGECHGQSGGKAAADRGLGEFLELR
jgi:hypothetical protein